MKAIVIIGALALVVFLIYCFLETFKKDIDENIH